MRCFLFIAFFVFLCQICLPQKLEIVEPLFSTIFEIVGVQDKKYDANGVPCAVVKVYVNASSNYLTSRIHENSKVLNFLQS